MKMWKRKIVIVLTICLLMTLFSGCGKDTSNGNRTNNGNSKKVLTIGDTTFNPSNEELDVNPHNAYSGWACIRYGIGETLVKYSDTMEIEPWLAKEWETVDSQTWRITLQENVKFSSGREMDAAAVKQCLEQLLELHDRAASDTKIDAIEAEGLILTIHTSEPKPALLNYLGDPYGCIIDIEAGKEGGIVAGTGPYAAVDCVSGDHLSLVKNENYWNGTPKLDEITIRTITDGNTLANALQSGEIQAAYGMAYESYPLFKNDNYTFSQISTSRCFFVKMNFTSNSVCSDPAVRKAIAMGIDKNSFVNTLLDGNGYSANGVFPEGSAFGGDKVQTEDFDLEGAKNVLEEAGWIDTDGDGIREKDGKKLEIKWLTYPSRQELPLLAEFAQATLKEIGMNVIVNCTADNNTVCADPTQWDAYAMANVQAPTGDPEYWFTVFATSSATKNQGKYSNAELDALAQQLSTEFDPQKRAELAVQMQQEVLDDNAFVFCSFLKMSQISRSNVTGYNAHACDYYQITAELDIQ